MKATTYISAPWRFKTKQEFLAEYGKDWRLGNGNWPPEMDHLFGNPYYNTDNVDGWGMYDRFFTDDKHPYEDLNLKMKVTLEESEKVQKKAFKLGYRWSGSNELKVQSTDRPYLYIDQGIITYGNMPETFLNYTKNIELTFEQFLNGDLPDYSVPEDKCPEPMIAGAAMMGEPKKYDSYITKEGLAFWWYNNKEVEFSLLAVWESNLMSEEAFKAKHKKLVLKFGKWEVEVRKDEVIFACHGHSGKRFSKEDIKQWIWNSERILTNGADLKETYNWLLSHKKDLEL